MTFKLTAEEVRLNPVEKERKNAAQESADRAVRYASARLAIHIFKRKEIFRRDIKRLSNSEDKKIAFARLIELEAIESWLEHEQKFFEIVTEQNRKYIQSLVDSRGHIKKARVKETIIFRGDQ